MRAFLTSDRLDTAERCPAPRGQSAPRRARVHLTGRGAHLRVAIAVSGIVLAAACGGGSNGGMGGGSPISPSTGGPGPIAATITIANGAVAPQEVTIAVGDSVRFVNNDTRARDMTSDPHPTHTNCPAINVVGNLQPGQSRTTHGFSAAGTCGFHDHNDPDNPAVRGRIIVR